MAPVARNASPPPVIKGKLVELSAADTRLVLFTGDVPYTTSPVDLSGDSVVQHWVSAFDASVKNGGRGSLRHAFPENSTWESTHFIDANERPLVILGPAEKPVQLKRAQKEIDSIAKMAIQRLTYRESPEGARLRAAGMGPYMTALPLAYSGTLEQAAQRASHLLGSGKTEILPSDIYPAFESLNPIFAKHRLKIVVEPTSAKGQLPVYARADDGSRVLTVRPENTMADVVLGMGLAA